MSFYYFLFRSGMTGGSARSVYKMLCTSSGWEDQSSEGCIDFIALGIVTHSILWLVEEASSQQEAETKARLLGHQAAKKGYEVFCISLEDAMKIEKGEKVEESPGRILPEIVESIRELYLKKKEAGEEIPGVMTISKEELEKRIKEQG